MRKVIVMVSIIVCKVGMLFVCCVIGCFSRVLVR